MPGNDNTKIRKHFESAGRVDKYNDIYLSEITAESSWNSAFGIHRQDLIRRKLAASSGVVEILEVGCGVGVLLANLISDGFSAKGIDQSAAMVSRARERFSNLNISPDLVTQEDLFHYEPTELFDAVIANGVIPYFKDQAVFLQRLGDLVRPGGKIAVTHRNSLFNLVAFNQGTIDFVSDEIFSEAPENIKRAMRQEIEEDMPALMEGKTVSISDDVFRSAENPLSVEKLYLENGYSIDNIHYTFIHPISPRFGDRERNGDQALNLANTIEDQWQGMFSGSQFLVLATKKEPD